MKIRKKCLIWNILSMILVIMLGIQVPVYAIETIDTSKPLSLTIECVYDGTPVENEYFSLYKIADIAENWTLTVENEFRDYQIDFTKLEDQEEWQNLTEILSTYIKRDNLTPDCEGKTDQNGILQFEESDGEITRGLYLIMEEPLVKESMEYTTKPFLVSLPENEENGEITYDVIVEPKEYMDLVPDSMDMNVLKVWDDEKAKSYRPDSIEVELLKDGEPDQTITLNEENNWRYTWKDLDGSAQWNVLEKNVPDHYTVTSSTDGDTCVITNEIDPSLRDRTNNAIDNDDSSSSRSSSIRSSKSGRLPQTGLFWWPVPVLFASGLLLIIIGVLRNQKNR